MTLEERKIVNYNKNRNSKKMIDMLPILTQISENQLLVHSDEYKDYASNLDLYMPHCGTVDCPTCKLENE